MLGLRQRDDGNERIRPEVREVQDEMLNIYRRTFDNQKSWAKRFTEEVNPQNQNDLNVIESVEGKKESFMKILQEKLNLIDSVNKGFVKVLGLSVKSREQIEKFGNSYDIIRPYNEIIRNYLNPKINSKTRDEIKSIIQEIIPLLNQIIYITNITFRNTFFDPPYTPEKITSGKRFLTPMLTTYIALLVIQKNLFRGTYSTINKPQLDVQYQEWVSSLSDDDRTFLKAIEIPTGETQAQRTRELLIEEDRGYPLSSLERLNLHNAMFGISSRKNYTPTELALLEQEDLRNAEAYRINLEDLRRDRGFFDQPSVTITPGVPFPAAEVEEEAELEPEPEPEIEIRPRGRRIVGPAPELLPALRPGIRPRPLSPPRLEYMPPAFPRLEYRLEAMPEAMPEAVPEAAAAAAAVPRPRSEFNDFLRNTIDSIDVMLNRDLEPTQKLRLTAAKQKENIKEVRDEIIAMYTEAYEKIYKKPISVELEQGFIDAVIKSKLDSEGERNLTDEIIDERENPRSTPQRRADLYNNLKRAVDETIIIINKEKKAKREAERAARVMGKGRPRYKVSQAIHYEDARNDPYLIR
jgi:hypothetical protein